MPEIRECIAAYQFAHWGFRQYIQPSDGTVLRIYYDPTYEEGASISGYAGHPQLLDHASTCLRGSGSKSQKPLWPPFRGALSAPLVLRAVNATNRALILDFTVAHLLVCSPSSHAAISIHVPQFRYLQHTSIQWYSKQVWNDVIMKLRGFSVAVAFEFHTRVLAFVSGDNLFEPHWSETQFSIPPTPDGTPQDFLRVIATWIRAHALKPRSLNTVAHVTITDLQDQFHGVGRYTIMELFFLAGLPPMITTRELFTNASRTARFISALYTFTVEARDKIWDKFLKSAIHDGIIAPTLDQRLRFASWLHVWAKERALIPDRMAQLVDEINDKIVNYDPFEPSYILPALRISHNLGHLIFGQQLWDQIRGDMSQTSTLDPITTLFHQTIQFAFGHKADTHLKPGHLQSLQHYGLQSWRPVFCYLLVKKAKLNSAKPGTKGGQVWSILKIDPGAPVVQILGKALEERHFKTIIEKTLKVSVGLLEFFGHGHILCRGNQRWVAACLYDPTVPRDLEEKYLSGQDRKSGSNQQVQQHGPKKKKKVPFNALGARHRARDRYERRRLEQKLGLIPIHPHAGSLRPLLSRKVHPAWK
uniref:Uncharacterized protein n=1 Tax=Mycena chlorophos TaxID=658473 RepID=A0ABQ0L948_MYCCL|nr:predicted protein [Mycena chlorophos]